MQEEDGEAAHQEIEWEFSQAQNSAIGREELDEILDDPNVDDEDEDIEHVVGHGDTRKRYRRTVCISLTRLKLTSSR